MSPDGQQGPGMARGQGAGTRVKGILSTKNCQEGHGNGC